MKVSFDGVNKQIVVLPGFGNIDVGTDLYSAWKNWVQQSDNLKYEAAFRTFGGDATGSSQYAPRYYFLQNGWRVVVNDASVVFQTNLYTEEGDSPYIVNNAAVTARSADVPIIKSTIDERLDYRGYVYVDSSSPFSGVEYPYGTEAQPVNTIANAIQLAEKYGLHRLHIRGTFSISENLAGYVIEGNVMTTMLTFLEGSVSVGCSFNKVNLTGTLCGGDVLIQQSMVHDLLRVSGAIHESGVTGTVQICANKTLTMVACVSLNPGGTNPVIDMNLCNDSYLNLRSYSGGIDIINCDTENSVGTVDFIAGKAIIRDTCTNGFLSLRGVSFVTDESNGTLIDMSALTILAKQKDTDAPTWDSAIGVVDAYQNGNSIVVRWAHASDASGEVQYNVYISDVHANLFNCKIGGYDGNITSVFTEFDGTIPLSTKVYYISVRAEDKYGNETSNTNYIQVSYVANQTTNGATPEEIWSYNNRTLTQDIDVSSIPAAVWSYVSRELTVAAGLTPAQEAKLDQIIAQSISPDDVWNHTTRELTVPSGMTNGQEAKLDQILSNVQSIGTSTNAIYNAVQTLPQMAEIRDEMVNVHFGKMEIDSVNKQISFFDKQNQMVAKFNVFDEHGNPSVTRVFKREVVV